MTHKRVVSISELVASSDKYVITHMNSVPFFNYDF